MTQISALIISRNEEHKIKQCLDSLEGIADEIIVVDSYSTDNTVKICEEAGCKVVQRAFPGYGAQRQYATSLATHRYILSIDADEVLSPALRTSLKKLKSEGLTHRVYSFTRMNFYCEEPIRHCGWYPDIQIRLFDKRYATWDLSDVFEKVIFPGTLRPEKVDGDILHYRCRTPEEYHRTIVSHAMIEGRVLANKLDKVSFLTPWLKGIKAFANCYFKKYGFLDGNEGFAISKEEYLATMEAYKLARKILNKNHDSDC